MSSTSAKPLLPEIQRAAAMVQAYLDAQDAAKAPRRDLQRDWAERLDRCRQVDQSKMPPWRGSANIGKVMLIYKISEGYGRHFNWLELVYAPIFWNNSA